MKKEPRILFWDIETSQNIVAAFQLLNKSPINYQAIIQERFIICASWKWLGEARTQSVSVIEDEKRFKASPADDYHVVKTLHEVLSKADAIVAHYGDNFDVKFFNTRAIFHGLDPLPSIIQIDTYKLAKKKFKFNSNRLDYIGMFLGLGRKKQVGHDLWMSCLNGDESAVRKMVSYNKQDVALLEHVYNKLVTYVTNPVNRRLFTDKPEETCPRCGEKDNFMSRGWSYTLSRRYKRYQCKSCRGWFQSSKSELIEQEV